ncbi:hypothetical protein H2198_005991 [Neophaeococcomyces mojaviensis]|uniref:Uncharacterized protein n=1 Tax=Neophaeococcomyces mojaviensis TaxID=3383035 RepID=A0ACC3A427_9EURO|nr:hypothetical protein H2198_005991 [Knufia sp. JES_112]
MAEDAQGSISGLRSHIDLPDELIANILLQASTPTFIQLTRTSKQLQQIARSSREVLLHHLNQVPGDKSVYDDPSIENEKLFLLLRQRAANHLYGANFTANMHEHLVRNAQLDASASSISGLDADYVRMTLVYKDSQMLNMYTNHCSIKERIEGNFGRNVKILKLVQWARWVSCLVSWRKEEDSDFSELESDSEKSETEMLEETNFKPTANTQLAEFYLIHQEAKIGSTKKRKMVGNEYEYRIVHFDVYTIEDSQTFIIEPYLDCVPRDFAVYSTTNCAVLWDRDTPKRRPTVGATVVVYTATKAQLLYPVKYDEKVVWPKTGKPERPNADSDDDDTPEYLPEGIGFFKDGRRIKLYDSGSVVPYEVTSATTAQYDQYASTNVIRFDGFQFTVDTPFFGTHATYWDELSQHSFCFQTHLCLGMSTLDIGDDDENENENEVRVLCILRSHSRLYPENCEHRISLQRMTHVSASNSTVVARLWGFEELHTNLTGKETVAISPGGTRIAIAMWDKVYVYPINPKILCEDVAVDSSDDEAKPKKKKKKPKKPWASSTTNYYQRKRDSHLLGWKIAEVRPIVLDLKGAVAHKMNWSAAKGPVTDTFVPEPVIVVKDEEVPEIVIEAEGAIQVSQEGNSAGASGDLVVLESNNTIEAAVVPAENTAVQTEPLTNGIEAEPEPEPEPEVTSEISNAEPQSLPTQAETKQQTVTGLQTTASNVEDGHKVVVTPSEAASAEAQPSSSLPISSAPVPVSDENTQIATLPPKVETPPTPPASLSPAPPVSNMPPLASGALPPLNGATSLSPLSTNSLVQPAKPSPKRKEKAPEVTNSEIIVPTGLEKEKYAQTQALDARSNSNVSPPASPVLTKVLPKPKQTVSEALTAPSTPPQQQSQLQLTAEPSMTAAPVVEAPEPKPQPSLSSCQPQASTEIALQEAEPVSDTKTVTPAEAEAVVLDLSKTSTTTAAEVSPTSTSTTAQPAKPDEVGKASKPKKRITEDELIILTDRGVQVWNVGARAKGKRKKSILPLEESVKGRLPRRKGKAKNIVEEVQDEGEEGDVD